MLELINNSKFLFSSKDLECFTSVNEYQGRVSITRSGKTCQKWTSQYPHSHGFATPNKGFGDHNYCRYFGHPPGLIDAETVWCFTTDSNVTWDYCDVGEKQISCLGMYPSSINLSKDLFDNNVEIEVLQKILNLNKNKLRFIVNTAVHGATRPIRF